MMSIVAPKHGWRTPSPAIWSALFLRNTRRFQEYGEVRLKAVRLMHVAAETGARFVREGIRQDPSAWLLTPCRLFDGRAAVQACSTPEGFRRAVVLHGLSLPLDAEPHQLRGIPASEFVGEAAKLSLPELPPTKGQDLDPWERGPPSLYSCCISSELAAHQVQIFCAMIAHSPWDVRLRLRQRYGRLLEDEAQVRLGFDWSEPIATALVSEAMAHLLRMVEDHPTSALADGLDFHVEQRFVS